MALESSKKIVTIGITGSYLTDQRMQRIAKTLSDNGYRVNVYHRPKPSQLLKIESLSEQFVQVYTLHTFIQTGPWFYLLFNLQLLFKLLFKPSQLYYAVDADTLLAFTILSKLKGIDLVYDAHEYFTEVPELNGHQLKKAIWNKVVAIGTKQAKLNITVGPAIAKAMSVRYKTSFISVRNVPLKQFANNNTNTANERIILYQGALNKGRMLETLIDAMRELPNYVCWIVGEGDLSMQLREQAKGLNNVHFKGLITPHELKAITPSAYLGYNLLDDSESLSYHYSLSNKYFDYIQSAVPSVSSALPEYIALNNQYQCGVCIDNNKKAIIELIQSWELHPENYQTLKENTKFAAQDLNWENEAQVLLNALSY